MGIFSLESLQGIGDILPGIGTLAKDIRSAITGEISPEKKAEIELKLTEMEASAMNAQAAINQAEAGNKSMFVAGWRPWIGWIIGCAIGVKYLLYPMATWVADFWGVSFKPLPIDMTELWPIIVGMLGLVGARSYEKAKGVQGNH